MVVINFVSMTIIVIVILVLSALLVFLSILIETFDTNVSYQQKGTNTIRMEIMGYFIRLLTVIPMVAIFVAALFGIKYVLKDEKVEHH